MPELPNVHAALLDWYAREARDLPWRRTRDPYAILVAEVMLQQTQVDRVIPIWQAWLAQFPTLRALSEASRADAIRAWRGLGYNLRAVRLHAIACQCVAQFGGELPGSVADLLRLKGVGRYTAGAVACFAFGQPVAMVDTNVRRVLSRVFGIQPGEVEAMAQSVVPAEAAYNWNQALMDLGATLCRSRQPLCLACPLVSDCGGPRFAETRKKTPSERFTGSNPFYRGRILTLLRELPTGQCLELSELAAQVDGRGDLVVALSRDGLLAIDAQGRVRLADGEAESADPTSRPSAAPASRSLG